MGRESGGGTLKHNTNSSKVEIDLVMCGIG